MHQERIQWFDYSNLMIQTDPAAVKVVFIKHKKQSNWDKWIMQYGKVWMPVLALLVALYVGYTYGIFMIDSLLQIHMEFLLRYH
jgi:hypothetical protein